MFLSWLVLFPVFSFFKLIVPKGTSRSTHITRLLSIILTYSGTLFIAFYVHRFTSLLTFLGIPSTIELQCKERHHNLEGIMNCLYEQFLLRSLFAVTVCQTLMAILNTLSPLIAEWFESWLLGSIITVLAVWNLAADIPNTFFVYMIPYVWAISSFVLVFQSALVIDFAYTIHERWDRFNNWITASSIQSINQILYGVTALFLFILSTYVTIQSILLLSSFGLKIYITTSYSLCLFGFLVSCRPNIPAGSLLTAALISLYSSTTFLLALCEYTQELYILKPLRLWLGCLFWLITTWRTSSILCNPSPPFNTYEQTDVKAVGSNLLLIAFSSQLTLILLDWVNSPSAAWEIVATNLQTKETLPISFYVITLGASWSSAILYLWTTIAPVVLTNRVF